MRLLLSGGLLAALFLLTACSGPRLLGNPEHPYVPPRPPQVGDILHVPTGWYVDETAMLDALFDRRIVYYGETHDNPASHRLELTLLKAMHKRYPGRTAVAMEMLTPAQQESLDAWSRGDLSEKEFQRQWYKSWSLDYDYYRELLDYVRSEKIPLLGINADKALVKAVGRSDFAELSGDEQARLPKILDMNDPYQSALSAAIFGGHDKGGKRLAGFQRVQTLWDETMAANIVRFLESEQGEDYRLLVIAGGNHVRNGFGIPRRVFRDLPLSYAIVGNDDLEVSESKKQDAFMQVKLPLFPMPAYDYVVYTRYEDLEKSPEIKLGVMLDDRDKKVIVKSVLPGSSGESAGLKEEDQLLALDGEDLGDSFDLVYALRQKKAGDHGRLKIRRGEDVLELDVVYAPATQHGTKPGK